MLANCPCCSNTLFRQIRQREIVWFCRHCWQEMPAPESRSPLRSLLSKPGLLGASLPA